MCYEPLRFSPIFRRFVNSRESRVGLPLTPLNLTTKSVCALAQSSLFCGVCLIALRSLAHSHKQQPPHFYKQPTNQNPSSSSPLYMRKLEAEVPSRGLHTKPHARPKLGCRVYVSLTPRYISDIRTLQFDSGGGVVVSSRLLSSRLVSLLSSSCLYLWCRSLSSLYQPPVSLSSCRLVSLSIRRAKVELNSLGSNLLTTELLRFITVLSEYRFTRTEQSKNNRALFYYATP